MDLGIFICSEMMEFALKGVHMVRYELILRLDEAIWLSIISPPTELLCMILCITNWNTAARMC